MKKKFKIWWGRNANKLLKIAWISAWIGLFIDYFSTLLLLTIWPEDFVEGVPFAYCFMQKHGVGVGLTLLLLFFGVVIWLIRNSYLLRWMKILVLGWLGAIKIFAGVSNFILLIIHCT